MIEWFLNIFGLNEKSKPVLTDDSVNEGDSIVLDNGEVEVIKEQEDFFAVDHDETERMEGSFEETTPDNPQWDKPEEWSETLSESVSAVFKELNEMPQEEFDALIEENIHECHPDTCDGECQGAGWCDIAVEYRTKTDHIKRKL